jgi:ComF family protein
MIDVKEIRSSFLHLFFPHVCVGCGTDIISEHNEICLHCNQELPVTNFEQYSNNPVEKRFWGRLSLQDAAATLYFSKESLMQRLIHQFKYKRNKDLGLLLGRIMGDTLKRSNRFKVDALVPLPLFPKKEAKRGYNQSEVLCNGIAEILGLPVLNNVITRPQHTETQTRKGRIERWKNIEGKFFLADPAAIKDKHILLVDDVITTGATLESCGAELLKAENVQLSIACLCYAST